MLGRFPSRPIGWFTMAATAAAMAATMAVAPSGGATGATKEHAKTFEPQCVIAPGVLNIESKLSMTIRFSTPEAESTGESIELTGASVTIASKPEIEPLFSSVNGVHAFRGRLTKIPLETEGYEPSKLNLADPPEFPSGLPFVANVEKGTPQQFTAPSLVAGETGRTFSDGPLRVTAGPGTTARIVLSSEPAFEKEGEGGFRATGAGIVFELEGLGEGGERVVGPLLAACTPPAPQVLAESSITQTSTSFSEVTITCTSHSREPLRIEPSHGPEAGGTQVRMVGINLARATEVLFGSKPATHFELLSNTEIKAVTPPGTGTVAVTIPNITVNPCSPITNQGTFTYDASVLRPEFKNWTLSGSVTPKALGQPITLPAGSTFNGSGELNPATGAGSVTGSFAVPAFSSSVKLFGALPLSLGMTLTTPGPVTGSIAQSESVPGDESLSLPTRATLGVTSVHLFGLTVPTKCTTAEAISLPLSTNLTREALLSKSWSFAGTTTIPKFKCEGSLIGGLFGLVLSGILSGPETTYALQVSAPGG